MKRDLKKLVILTGAGMSAESGIQTFRDSDGLWNNHKIEDVATPEGWVKNPEHVQHFYNERRKQIMNCEPNKAHHYLKSLESYYDTKIITQNIDNLHERANSTSIVHLHGQIQYAKSSNPRFESELYKIKGTNIEMGERCTHGFQLRPHVVWFGEAVPLLDEAAKICQEADIILVIGTSLQVYPAASLAYLGTAKTVRIVLDPNCAEINLPDEFMKLPYSAVDGIKHLDDLLVSLR